MNCLNVRGLASPAGIFVGILSLSISFSAFASGPGWYNNFEQASQAARQQGRPIFVDFSTSWCSVCKQMDRTTLSDPNIIARLDNFVKVKVDADARPDLCNIYGVEAYPTFVNLDSNGRVMDKRTGFMRSQELANTLDRTWQSVAATMAVAQANRRPKATEQLQKIAAIEENKPTPMLLSGEKPLPAKMEKEIARAQEEQTHTARPRALPTEQVNLYNTTGASANDGQRDGSSDPQLQGSVYAMGAGPTSSRRSRFGGSVYDNSGLRKLAVATAQPGAIEDTKDKDSETKEVSQSDSIGKSENNVDNSDEQQADVKKTNGLEKFELKLASIADDNSADKKEDDESKASKDDSEKTAKVKKNTKAELALADVEKVENDKRATPKQPIEVASVDTSPVIASRLSALAPEKLPKPLLSRTSSGTSQPMAPAAAISSATSKDPLATIRRVQDDKKKPVAVSSAPVEIAPSKSPDPDAPKISEEAAPKEKKVSKASDEKTESKSEDSKKVAATEKPSTDKAEKAKKNTASRGDIDKWMKDADSKLVDGHKKDARSMYNKVVENDPKNKFGKSDMAYVKMVSLIVDRDSDSLRREAYSKIKEFDTRFPDSDHKDYYILIRAILAADLGKTTEADKLLGSYAERFPNSKYRRVARETWESLSPAKRASDKSSADSGKKRTSGSNS